MRIGFCKTGGHPTKTGVIFMDGWGKTVQVCEHCAFSFSCYMGSWRRPICYGDGRGSAEWLMEEAIRERSQPRIRQSQLIEWCEKGVSKHE